MNLTSYTMDKSEALAQLAIYRKELRTKASKAEHVQELADVYYQLSRGRMVLDVFESFKGAGVDERGEPRLAICRADYKFCFLRKDQNGSAKFRGTFGDQFHKRKVRAGFDFETPIGTFQWPTTGVQHTWEGRTWVRNEIVRDTVRTIVPIIPAQHMPNGSLDKYYLLWEVKEWEPVPPVDPLLLRKLTPNLFVVMAQWDLTPIEQAVMRGALAMGRA